MTMLPSTFQFPMIGFFLILLGTIFLLKNLGVISGGAWEVIWPILLILVGFSFLMRNKPPSVFWGKRFWWGKRSIDRR